MFYFNENRTDNVKSDLFDFGINFSNKFYQTKLILLLLEQGAFKLFVILYTITGGSSPSNG